MPTASQIQTPIARSSATRSVFDRVRLVMTAVFALGSATSLVAAWYFSTEAANEAFDQLLISATVQIAETISVADNRLAVAPPDSAFETLALSRNDRIFYAVRAPNGALLTGYPDLTTRTPGAPGETPRVSDAHFRGVSVRMASMTRHIAAPGVSGPCLVLVAQTREARHVLASTLMAKTALLIVALGALGFFASLVAARRALRPLTRIEEALALRDAHDVTPLDVDSPRETQALVDAINMVMARLADRMAKLHMFTAVAAHQIRTPLAALSAQVEMLETDRTAAARRLRMGRLRQRVAELGRLTTQLLGHAMIIYRADTVAHEDIDLAVLARSALADGVPLSLERDLAVGFDGPATPVMIRGDAIGLKEGLTNLVHNAVVHGAPSVLQVSVERSGDLARVVVFDDGRGIPKAQWETVLLPFAAARQESGGAGLGLSIVSDVIKAHGGKIGFRRPPGGGFEVTIELAAQGEA